MPNYMPCRQFMTELMSNVALVAVLAPVVAGIAIGLLAILDKYFGLVWFWMYCNY